MKKTILFIICLAVLFSIQAYGGDNQGGFTVEGRLTQADKPLEGLEVYLVKDDLYKKDVTDSNGFFRVTGLDKGSYSFDVIYRAPQADSNSPRNGLTDAAVYNQQIDIDSDMSMKLDLGISSISGKVPPEFIGDKSVFVDAKKWELVGILMPDPKNWVCQWMRQSTAKPDPNGNFIIDRLRPGKYYLALYKNGIMWTATEVFELNGSQKIENITFKQLEASLKITVVSAETKEPLDKAFCALTNPQDAHFVSNIAEGEKLDLTTDANGMMEYDNLPEDIYDFTTMKKGYLLKKIEGIKIGAGDNVIIEVALDKSAVVDFALSDELKEQTTGPLVFLLCKVTDLDSNEVYMPLNVPFAMQGHVVFLKMPDEYPAVGGATVDSALDLPGGRYRIEYKLFQEQRNWTEAFRKEPLYAGQVEVDVKAGQTTTIVIEGD